MLGCQDASIEFFIGESLEQRRRRLFANFADRFPICGCVLVKDYPPSSHDPNRAMHTATKFFREGVQGFLSNIDELFAWHSSPTDTNKRTLTPNSRRLCLHPRHLLLCGRLRLPLRLLPRRALPEEGHRLALSYPKASRRGIVGNFCSCPHGTLCPLTRAAGVSCGRWYVD